MKLRDIILFGMMLTGFAGCADFLDVQPQDKQSEKQLFATRGGYYMAVNGIYNKIAASALYGKNLSFELVDVISKRYQPLLANTYLTALSMFAYTDNSVEKELSSTWTAAYNTILNCNVVLENIDGSVGVLPEQERWMLKGEMLAVRAFLHFDMLRLFGPVYKLNPDGESIPYNESSRVSVLPLLTADSVIHEKILRDLNEAESLLVNSDPVIAGGPMASLEDGQDVYLRYRQLRMNYYAVLAEKARVYLWMGNREEALRYARLVKNAALEGVTPQFTLGPSSALGPVGGNGGNDFVFFNEQIFAMYIENFDDSQMASAANSYQYQNNYWIEELFPVVNGMTDIRLYQWYTSTWNASVGMYKRSTRKYSGLRSTETTNASPSRGVPLIRLAEMYLIIAECAPLDEANEVYRELLSNRNAPVTVLTETNREDVLKTEYLKEFYAEGQMFYTYKR